MSSKNMPLVYSVAAAVAATGGVITQSRMFDLIQSGDIKARNMDGHAVILAESLQSYLENLPEADARMKPCRSWRRPAPKPIDGVAPEQFAEILKSWRERNHYSTGRAGEILGCNRVLVSFWESGRRMPRDVLKIIDHIEKSDGMENPPTLARKVFVRYGQRNPGIRSDAP